MQYVGNTFVLSHVYVTFLHKNFAVSSLSQQLLHSRVSAAKHLQNLPSVGKLLVAHFAQIVFFTFIATNLFVLYHFVC